MQELFGNKAASRQVVSNLRSCWAGLKVLEMDLTLLVKDGYDVPVPAALVPGVRALLSAQCCGGSCLGCGCC